VKSAARRFPFSISPGSVNARSICRAKSTAFPDSKCNAPSPLTSDIGRAFVQMVGKPEAIASKIGMPKPSKVEGNTNRLARR